MLPQLQPSSTSQPQSPQIPSFSELGLMTGAADPMMISLPAPSSRPIACAQYLRSAWVVTPSYGGCPWLAALCNAAANDDLAHETLNLNAPTLLAAAGLRISAEA